MLVLTVVCVCSCVCSCVQLSAMLTEKQAELEVLEDEVSLGSVKKTFKEFATEMKASDKKAEGKVTVAKMQQFMEDTNFKNLSADEFELLSKLCTASARMVRLPDRIKTLKEEVESIETARDKAELEALKAKRAKKDAKAKDAAKRKLADTATFTKRKGRV